MKKLLISITLMALALSAGAQNFEGTFKQAKTLKVSGKVIKSEGEITYRPGPAGHDLYQPGRRLFHH